MTEKNYVIAVDSGTQSIRAVLFDAQGNELAIEQAQYDPYFSLQPGWAEQRTEDYWSKFCLVTKGLMAKISIDPEAIAGLGITTQRNTVIPMDKDGNALRPAIVWLDQRRTEGVKPVGGLWGLAFRLSGMRETVAYLQAEAEANWLQRYQPDIWKKTHKYLLLSGYLAIETGGSGLQLIIVLGKMIIFLLLSVAFGLWILPAITRVISRLPISQGVLTLAIIILLVYGLAAELVR